MRQQKIFPLSLLPAIGIYLNCFIHPQGHHHLGSAVFAAEPNICYCR